jgi:hypothetical protein
MNLEDYINKYADFKDKAKGALQVGAQGAAYGAASSLLGDAVARLFPYPDQSLSRVGKKALFWATILGLAGGAGGAYYGKEHMDKLKEGDKK